jgi:hypothetical protein
MAMTERKPAGMTFTSWIDQQISEAADRGAFDDLPGAGKPLPRRHDLDGETWVRDWVARSGGSPEDCLPTPLRLRKETERLAEALPGLPSADQVREVVRELNRRILQWRRFPDGPPIFVPLVNEEQMVSKWTEARAAAVPATPVAAPADARAPNRAGRRWLLGRKQPRA